MMDAEKDLRRRPSEVIGEEGRGRGRGGSTGQSRASKKRAKKKEKNKKVQPQEDEVRRDSDGDPDAPANEKKRRKERKQPQPRDLKSLQEGVVTSSRKTVGSESRIGATRKSSKGSNKEDSVRRSTSSSLLSESRKRPREVPERSAGGNEPSDVDPDDNDDDESVDHQIDDLDFFDAEAGKKVQFQPRETDQDDNDGDGGSSSSNNNHSVPPLAAAAEVAATRLATGKSATVPPPSVTNITQLLCFPRDDARASDAAAGPTKGESTNAEAYNAAPASASSSSSSSSSSSPAPASWLSQRTTEQRANAVLNFILQPSSLSTDEFYATYWEKKPLLVQATETGVDGVVSSSSPHVGRFKGLMGLATIQEMTTSQQHPTRPQPLYYGRDLNVTKYEKVNGTYRRRTLDPAHPSASRPPPPSPDVGASPAAGAQDPDRHYVRVNHDQLWDEFYGKLGCTVRLLCPHKHFPHVHTVLSLLEHEFGNMVGANAYLTPPNGAQGFAPHYDDIEAFCCQLEGQKRWKVYAPLAKAERLPRTSSRDYTPADLRDVEPVMDVVLSPGDVLYMPRGWIHQACTLPEASKSPDGCGHSLHLTISTMQQWAWVDLMENLMADALEALSRSDRTTLLRDGLPRNFVSYMGVMHDNSDESMPESLKKRPYEAQEEDADEVARLSRLQASREEFRHEAKRRISRVAQEAMNLLDASCDQMAKRFLSDRLPPAGLARDADLNLQPDSFCRLARPGIARLVLEDGKAVLYHCAENSLVFHEHPLSPLEFEMDDAPAIEQLTTVEPRWIAVQDLYHDSVEDKLAVAQVLYDEGILSVRS